MRGEGGLFLTLCSIPSVSLLFKYNITAHIEKNQWEVVSELAIMAQKLLIVGSL